MRYRDISDKIIAAAIDPNISENQMRILMLIISEYAGGDAALQKAIYLPVKQSAERLNIAADAYEVEINALEKQGLIKTDDDLEHVALN